MLESGEKGRGKGKGHEKKKGMIVWSLPNSRLWLRLHTTNKYMIKILNNHYVKPA